MKQDPFPRRADGFTMVELLVSAMISGAVGIAVFALMNAGMFLTAKNLSLNLTSNQMRGALDRVEQVLQQGDTNPALIDTAGAAVGSGDAAGVKLDRYMGGPYVVTVPAGGLVAGLSTLTLTRSTNANASPPLPLAGDVIEIDGTPATLRPRVAATNVGGIDGLQHQAVTATLAAPLAATVPTTGSSIVTAKLVRPVGFIVMPNGSRRELRYYHSIETTTNLDDPTQYALVSNQLATQGVDATPFSLVTIDSGAFLKLSLRVRGDSYDNRLRNQQSDEYNTFSRVDSFLRPKVNP